MKPYEVIQYISDVEKRYNEFMSRQNISEHEGKKYLREMRSASKEDDRRIEVDVYEVLKAFNVTCPATQHCIKKLLAAGQREKGDRLADLKGAMAALNRAIDFAERDLNERKDNPSS